MKKPTMLFDGDCGFCRKWIEKWRAKTGDKVIYKPYQKALKQFPQVSKADCQKAVQLILPDGTHYAAGRAVLEALALEGKCRFWLWGYKHIPFFGWLTEGVYKWVAGHRGKLSRL